MGLLLRWLPLESLSWGDALPGDPRAVVSTNSSSCEAHTAGFILCHHHRPLSDTLSLLPSTSVSCATWGTPQKLAFHWANSAPLNGQKPSVVVQSCYLSRDGKLRLEDFHRLVQIQLGLQNELKVNQVYKGKLCLKINIIIIIVIIIVVVLVGSSQ